jgi:hypothetical protein
MGCSYADHIDKSHDEKPEQHGQQFGKGGFVLHYITVLLTGKYNEIGLIH